MEPVVVNVNLDRDEVMKEENEIMSNENEKKSNSGNFWDNRAKNDFLLGLHHFRAHLGNVEGRTLVAMSEMLGRVR